MGYAGERLVARRKKIEERVVSERDGGQDSGRAERRMPDLAKSSFGVVEGESLMMATKEIGMSVGSDCTSASLGPSYGLKGLGVGDELAHSSLRISLGRWTTEEEVDYAANKIVEAVRKLRDLSPLYDMHQEGIDVSKIEWQAH